MAFNIDVERTASTTKRQIFATHFPFHMISGRFLALSQFEKECRIFDKYHRMCAISEAGHFFLNFIFIWHDKVSLKGRHQIVFARGWNSRSGGGIFGNKRHITVCWGHSAAYIAAASYRYRYESKNIYSKHGIEITDQDGLIDQLWIRVHID